MTAQRTDVSVDDAAVYLADWIYLRLADHYVPMAVRVKAAIWAYLWAVENKIETEWGVMYPSAHDCWQAWATRKEES